MLFVQNHQSSAADRFMMNLVLARHEGFRIFIELGTAAGITSLYFGLVARTRGVEFHTYV